MSELMDQFIGNYRLTRLLSQEGIVETYLAAHRRLDMTAIVKIVSVRLTAEQEQLFQRKVQPLAELMHKHIVRLLDFEVLQGRPVLFQDYFPAGTLRKVHPQGTRTVFRQALSYIKRLTDALQCMHARQIVHGDLRPENVMLGWESNILLNNCGLTELVRALVPESNYQPVEAFAYLAPECFQGQLLPASDQYALAVMVYEWLCGETPFQGSFSEQVTAHLTSEPPLLRTKAVDIPAEVEQVIMIALAKDPARRFASVQAFANALEQAGKSAGIISTSAASIVPTMPTPAPMAPTAAVVPGSSPSAPTVVAMPASSPSAPTVGATSIVSPSASTVGATPVPPFTPMPAEAGAAPAKQGGLSRRALLTTFTLGGIGLVAVSSAGTAALLNLPVQGAARPAQPRGTKLVGKLIATCPDTGSVEYLSWSPDGKRLASGGMDPDQTVIWEVSSAKQISAVPGYVPSLDRQMNFSYGWVGDRFYMASIDTTDKRNPLIRVRDLVGNKEVLVYQGYVSERSTSTLDIEPEYVAWSPNGQMIASLEYETGIRVWNAKTGLDISKFRVQVGDHGITDETTLWQSSMVWAPDNRHMATWGEMGIIYIWDTSTGKMVCSYSKHWDQHKNDQQFSDINPDMKWSPDSTRIVSSVATSDIEHSRDGVIHVWDARSGQDICTFNKSQPNSETTDMGWSADGKLIACVMKGNAVVWDTSSGAIVTTRYTQDGNDDIAWHPQRRYLASTMQSTTDKDDGYKGYIWDAMTGKEILRLNSTTEHVLAWSPDGMRLALGTQDHTVEIWQIWE